MASVSLTGSDAIIINGRSFNDYADGDFVVLNFDNELANMKVSKDGNAIYALNYSGKIVSATIRVLRGSSDDIYLNSVLQQMLNDFSGFSLMSGSFTKRVGDGVGNVANDIYQMSGGIITKYPGAKTNAEGDTEQSVAIYEIKFKNDGRSIQ